MDSPDRTRVLHAIEAAVFAPILEPVSSGLGPVGSTLFASVLQRCFDAGDR